MRLSLKRVSLIFLIQRMKKEKQEFEKIVVVSVIPQGTDERRIKENLDELEFLALTAGARSEKRFTQRLERANSRTYVGTGKLEEIKSYIEEHEIKLVIFDDELSRQPTRRHRWNWLSISISYPA